MILDRIIASRFSRVRRLWEGQTVALIGGGPSLTIAQVELVRTASVRCIGVNNAFLLAPWADVCYFADSHFWRWNHEGLVHREGQAPQPYECAGLTAEEVREKFHSFAGQKCSIQNSGANITDDTVHLLRNKTFPVHANGLSTEPDALCTGRHSGFQALNLAILAGAKRILLLGYDGKPGANKSHWFGEHPRPTPENAYPSQRQAFVESAAAIKKSCVEVLNCTPGSAIGTFPKMNLEDAL